MIVDVCRRLALPPHATSDVSIAVTEACANVVVHAYVEGVEGEVELHVTTSGDELHVLVRDRGPGVVPRLDSPGAGFGLPLIAALTSRFELRRPPGEEVTELEMTFPLSEGEGPNRATLEFVAGLS